MYEFTTAIATHAEMVNPKPPEASGAELAAFFRSQPGYRKQRRKAGAARPAAGAP